MFKITTSIFFLAIACISNGIAIIYHSYEIKEIKEYCKIEQEHK